MTPIRTFEHHNLRFILRDVNGEASYTPPRWLFECVRISDGHHVGKQRWLVHEPSDSEMQEIAHDWILEAVGNYEPPRVKCYACGTVMESATGSDTEVQFDGALEIRFGGGYGMFIDPMHEKYEAIICHRCAHELCETVDWINELVQPLSGHSHNYAKIPDLLQEGHHGWDLDRWYLGSPLALWLHLTEQHGLKPETNLPTNEQVVWHYNDHLATVGHNHNYAREKE